MTRCSHTQTGCPLEGPGAPPVCDLASAARAGGAAENPAVILVAETETLLRTCANPLFRAAAPGVNLVRLIHTRDAAINAFVDTGNPMFRRSEPPAQAWSAAVMSGRHASDTGCRAWMVSATQRRTENRENS